jgi:hypothetical protein
MKMRSFIDAVSSLTESEEGDFPPAINAALDTIQKAFEVLEEAIEAETHRLLAEQSLVWKDCIVAAFTGHGMTDIWIVPSKEMLAKLTSDAEEDEDEYWEIVERIRHYCREENPIRSLYLALDDEHRFCVPDFGFLGYKNGKEIDKGTYDRESNAIPDNIRSTLL